MERGKRAELIYRSIMHSHLGEANAKIAGGETFTQV